MKYCIYWGLGVESEKLRVTVSKSASLEILSEVSIIGEHVERLVLDFNAKSVSEKEYMELHYFKEISTDQLSSDLRYDAHGVLYDNDDSSAFRQWKIPQVLELITWPHGKKLNAR